jgi:hypothetical protein
VALWPLRASAMGATSETTAAVWLRGSTTAAVVAGSMSS